MSRDELGCDSNPLQAPAIAEATCLQIESLDNASQMDSAYLARRSWSRQKTSLRLEDAARARVTRQVGAVPRSGQLGPIPRQVL